MNRFMKPRATAFVLATMACWIAAILGSLPARAATASPTQSPSGADQTGGSQTSAIDPIRVTYVSVDAVYVSAGKKAGLAPGDTLSVVGGARAGVRLVVTTVSSHSAACRFVAGGGAAIEVDDVVAPLHPREISPISAPVSAAPSLSVTADAPRDTIAPGVTAPLQRGAARSRSENRLYGYIDVEYRLLDDLGEKGSSWQQPGISGRIVLDNIAGTGLSLRFRETSRWSYRDRPADGTVDERETTHRLTELALAYGSPESPFEITLGRTISSRIRGLGYIDGGYAAYRIGDRYRIGVAGGTEPDPENSSFSTSNASAAFFVAFEAGRHETQRIASTIAYSGSYHDGTVSREFVYLQNAYSYERRFVAYQSLEIDINRDWRRDAEGSSLSFSNFYLTSNFYIDPRASIDLSYDARKNVRDYRTISTPDSLFDDTVHSGLRGGLSWSLPKNLHLRAFAGVQQGENDSNTRYASLVFSARQLLLSADRLSLRIAWSDTPSTTTYSPAAAYWMRIARQTQLNLGGGAYLNSIRGADDDNYYLQLGADQWLGSRYSVSASARRYFGNSLESIEFTARAGVSF